MDTFERIATFALKHDLCEGEMEEMTRVLEKTVAVSLLCPGCGAVHGEAIELSAVRAHVLMLARWGGFTGTLDGLSVSEYERLVSSRPVVAKFHALCVRVRKSGRPQ